jgi:hypothetical protein
MAPAIDAKDKEQKDDAQKDEIQVVGHIPLTAGPVLRFFTTRHYSSDYLYAEREAGGGMTLIDVTNTSRPAVLSNVPSPASGAGSLEAVAGTSALVTSGPAAAAPTATQTVRIVDLSDPRNLKVPREFTGVTAIGRDDRRGLVFIANTEGIWILKQHLAQDPEVEKAYANYVLYSH